MIPGGLGHHELRHFDVLKELCKYFVYCIYFLVVSIEYIISHHKIIKNRVQERISDANQRNTHISSRRSSPTVVNDTDDSFMTNTASINNIPESIRLQHIILEKNQRIYELESLLSHKPHKRMSMKNVKSFFQ